MKGVESGKGVGCEEEEEDGGGGKCDVLGVVSGVVEKRFPPSPPSAQLFLIALFLFLHRDD